MHQSDTTPMTPEEALTIVGGDLDAFYFIRDTSHLGRQLARQLQGGQKADPNVGPAIRTAEELGRRLETLAVVRNLPPAPEPSEPRLMPSEGDLPAMLSDAGRDARYVRRLTEGGMGMSMHHVPETLRIVRALRPKLDAIWLIYETMPKPEHIRLTGEEREAFWRKMDEMAQEPMLGR